MRRLLPLLTAVMLLTACHGGLGSIAKRHSVCINTIDTEDSKSVVCGAPVEAEDESEDTTPTLLTGFMLNR